jgi:GAF domain-containing protein
MQRLPDRSFLYPVLDAAISVDAAKAGHIMEYQPPTRELHVAHRHLSAPFCDHFRVARAGDGSAGGQVLADRRRILISDVENDVAYAPHVSVALAEGIRAVYALPLIVFTEELVGALTTHYARGYQPPARSRERFDQLARIAAVVLACATLREQFERHTRTVGTPPPLSSGAIHAALISRDLLARVAEQGEPRGVVDTAEHQLRLLVTELKRLEQSRGWMRPN